MSKKYQKFVFGTVITTCVLLSGSLFSQVIDKKIQTPPPGISQPAGEVKAKPVIFGDCTTPGTLGGMWVLDSLGDTLQHVSSREGRASFAPDELRAILVDPLNRLKVLQLNKPGESFLIPLPANLLPKDPVWSPTGDVVAFYASDADRVRQIYTVEINVAGSGFKQLTHDSLPALHPAWHPTGKKLLVTRAVNGSDLGLYLLSIDDGGFEDVFPPDSLQLMGGVFSPDAKYIVAAARGSGNLVRIDADGSNPINITKVGNAAFPFSMPRFGKSSAYFICSGKREGMRSAELFEFSMVGAYFKILTDPKDNLGWNYGAPNR